MAFILRTIGIWNTCAISKSCLSVCRIPWSTEVYITGNTIKKLIKIGKLRLGIHTSAKIIKLATGVALASNTTGWNSCSNQLHAAAKPAIPNPTTTARVNHYTTRKRLKPTRTQRSTVGTSLYNACITWNGVGSRTACPTAMAAICHPTNQKPVVSKNLTALFCTIVEIILWHCTTDGLSILFH